MHDDDQVYDHPVVSAHARRLITVLAAVAALLLGLMAPAQAANGQITGTVTGTGVGPAADVWVYALQLLPEGDVDVAGFAVTDSTGGYGFSVPAGTYVLYFASEDGDYEDEMYDDVHTFDFEDATPVVVSGGGTAHANAELTPYASIAGHVTKDEADPSYGIRVFDDTGDQVGWGFVEDDGSYHVSGLSAGSYRLAFNRLSGFAFSAPEFYDDHAEGGGLASGDVVTLAGGEHRTGVNAVLSEGGHITGTLEDTDGNPIRCTLQAYTSNRSLVTRSGRSDAATGAFDITGLSTGSYLVRVVNGKDCKNGMQYVDGTGGPLGTQASSADPVAVTRGVGTALAPALVYDLGPKVTNVMAPSVIGSPVVDELLTATRGTWSPSSHLSYHYQWLADGAALPWETSRYYEPVPADVGKKLSVRVTVTRGPRTATATSAATAPVTGPVNATLFNVVPPRVTGLAAVDSPLTADPGTWSVAGATFVYVWITGTRVLQSSASPAFTPRDDIFKQPLALTVRASRPGYQPSQVTLSVSNKVQAGVFSGVRTPKLKGAPRVGSVVKVRAAKVSPAPRRILYLWYRDDKLMHGVDGTRYTLRGVDVGHQIQVLVVYRRLRYTPAEVRTRLLGPVTR